MGLDIPGVVFRSLAFLPTDDRAAATLIAALITVFGGLVSALVAVIAARVTAKKTLEAELGAYLRARREPVYVAFEKAIDDTVEALGEYGQEHNSGRDVLLMWAVDKESVEWYREMVTIDTTPFLTALSELREATKAVDVYSARDVRLLASRTRRLAEDIGKTQRRDLLYRRIEPTRTELRRQQGLFRAMMRRDLQR